MNKGSHISLAVYILERTDGMLNIHKRAFLMGSIIPDCLPSFLTTRHTVTETFEIFRMNLSKTICHYHRKKRITAYYCRHLGIIMHYLADYFTFPHNTGYSGSVKEHIEYEKQLEQELSLHLEKKDLCIKYQNKEDEVDKICEYILEQHKVYLALPHDLITDCNYITELCSTIAMQILAQASFSQLAHKGEEIQDEPKERKLEKEEKEKNIAA